MINIATFNIFWFPSSSVSRISRSVEDERLIERIIERLNCDLIVFQEILDVGDLATLLTRIPGRQYQICQASPPVAPGSSSKTMHVALACDAATVETIRSDMLLDPVTSRKFKGRRLPVVAHVRHRASDWAFTIVGVHLKSGSPNPSPGGGTLLDERRKETEHLAEWLSGTGDSGFGKFSRPPTDDVLVLGDFNLVGGNHLLDSLTAGVLANWRWLKPAVKRSLGPQAKPVKTTVEQWSTFLDRVFIDQLLVSPALDAKVSGSGATVFAFDLAAAFEASRFRKKESFRCIPYKDANYGVIENLYRVSDHRPVRVSLNTP